MAVELKVRGAEDFARLSKRLRAMGESGKGLRRELMKGLREAAKPAQDDVLRSFADRLPHRGGLAADMARSKMSLQARGGQRPTVKIKAKSPFNVKVMEAGKIRHPVYGVWRKNTPTQSIDPGVFSDPIEARAPQMRRDMEKVIRDVARKIEGGH